MRTPRIKTQSIITVIEINNFSKSKNNSNIHKNATRNQKKVYDSIRAMTRIPVWDTYKKNVCRVFMRFCGSHSFHGMHDTLNFFSLELEKTKSGPKKYLIQS